MLIIWYVNNLYVVTFAFTILSFASGLIEVELIAETIAKSELGDQKPLLICTTLFLVGSLMVSGLFGVL